MRKNMTPSLKRQKGAERLFRERIANHGRFIYLFSHIRTHQVIYSLKKNFLRPGHDDEEKQLLKTLPFYGKKTVPTELRQDLWRPFATVTMPEPNMGLSAFRRLTEYRAVRNHAWTATTAADVQKLGKRIEEEYGIDAASTKTSPEPELQKLLDEYHEADQYRRQVPNNRERPQLLMDQPATSVADLAASIKHAASKAELKPVLKEAGVVSRWKHLETTAQTSPEDIEKMEKEKGEILTYLHSAKSKKQSVAENSRARHKRKRLIVLKTSLKEIKQAREATQVVNGQQIDQALRDKWPKDLNELVQGKLILNKDPEAIRQDQEAQLRHDLQRFRLDIPKEGATKGEWQHAKERLQHAKYAEGYWEDNLDPKKRKDGSIMIEWADRRNARFAQEWIAQVGHEDMDPEFVIEMMRQDGDAGDWQGGEWQGRLRPLREGESVARWEEKQVLRAERRKKKAEREREAKEANERRVGEREAVKELGRPLTREEKMERGLEEPRMESMRARKARKQVEHDEQFGNAREPRQVPTKGVRESPSGSATEFDAIDASPDVRETKGGPATSWNPLTWFGKGKGGDDARP